MKWLKQLIRRVKYHLSHEWCYDRMAEDGLAKNSNCHGQMGGDTNTEWLAMMCMDCPHWVPVSMDLED